MKKKIWAIVAILLLSVFGVFFYFLLNAKNDHSLPLNSITINTKQWNRYFYLKDDFKNLTYISYPDEWMYAGVNEGDTRGSLFFTQRSNDNKTALQVSSILQSTTTSDMYPSNVVAVVYVRNNPDAAPVYNATPFPFVEIERKNISVLGHEGTLIMRDVTVSKKEIRRELWAEFPNIYNTAFEFGMNASIYTNSDEVFDIFLKSIVWEIEKKKPEAKVSTKDWKTCRNTSQAYEFKYPSNWKISVNYKEGKEDKTKIITNCDGDYEALSIISPDTFVVDNPIPPEGSYNPEKTTTCTPSLQMEFTPNNKISEWNNDKRIVDDKWIIDISNHYSNKIEKIYTLDGINGYMFGFSKDYLCQPGFSISFAQNNNLYSVKNEGIATDTFETILSTFKSPFAKETAKGILSQNIETERRSFESLTPYEKRLVNRFTEKYKDIYQSLLESYSNDEVSAKSYIVLKYYDKNTVVFAIPNGKAGLNVTIFNINTMEELNKNSPAMTLFGNFIETDNYIVVVYDTLILYYKKGSSDILKITKSELDPKTETYIKLGGFGSTYDFTFDENSKIITASVFKPVNAEGIANQKIRTATYVIE